MIMRIPLLRTVCKAIVSKADWDESKHPRADNGQFGSGSGTSRGGSKKPKPSKTKRKMERRAEAAGQEKLGGAIQTLLGGGSALDKIGWLKTSEKPAEGMTEGMKPEETNIKNPPRVDMSGVPKDKSLIIGSVSVSYDTKVSTRNTRFFGGEDSPSGEHVHGEDTGYITVPNVENFIYVQTHGGKSGWYPDIYNNTRRTNYYPGSKENALTDIAAHPGGPKADDLYPTLKDAIASVRSIPKEYSTSPHSNKPPKTFDGAAVLEEYYRTHPEKRPKQPETPAKDPEKPKAEEKPKLPYQELLDQPLPNDHYKLVDLHNKIKDTDERPVKGFEFPKDDPRYTKLKEIRAKIREIDAQTGASARNMAFQQEMDIMEGGREFENPSAYRSWAPPKYRPGPREATPTPAREAPKPAPAPTPAKKPEQPDIPKNPNAGKGSPATFEEMFGKSPDHIKVSGSIDHTKPFVLTVEGKTFDHRERLKALGFKYSSANKNWYKGIVPPEGGDAKGDLLNHIKEVSSEPGATSQLRAKVQQGKLVPKKRTMSASEAALLGVKR